MVKGDRFHTNANEDQLKAIQTTEGALLIIAGPRSGKTFTLFLLSFSGSCHSGKLCVQSANLKGSK